MHYANLPVVRGFLQSSQIIQYPYDPGILPSVSWERVSEIQSIKETTKKSPESEIAKTIILTCDVARSACTLPEP